VIMQVSKEGLAARVLDEHQVGRFFVEDDLEFLFVLDEDEDGLVFDDTDSGTSQDLDKPSSSKPSTVVVVSGVSGGTQCANPTQEKGVAAQCTNPPQEKGAAAAASSGKLKRMAFSIPDDAPPRDDLMGRLLLEYRPRWVVRYHEHEPLLEDLEDEKLSKEEQTIAWESFQSEGTDRFVAPTLSAPIPSDDTTTTTSTTPKPQRCKPGDHVRQLVRDSMKPGASMLCKVCGDQISWESVRRK
jgi:transcriptional regulator ATRX